MGFIAFFIAFTANNLFAQTPGNAFSSLKFRINVVVNRSGGELNNYWTSQKGIDGSVEMPFYFGSISGGLRYIPYKEKEPYFHDFNTNFYYLGWGKEIRLPFNIGWYNGIKFGGYNMGFHDDSLTIYQRDETELSAGISSRLSFYLFKDLDINVSVDYAAAFTHKRIELFLISAGVAYSVKTPEWIKEILK